MGQVVPFPVEAIGAQRLDQVGVGGDVLQPVEPGRQARRRIIVPALGEAELDVVHRGGGAVAAEGSRDVGVVVQVASEVEAVRGAALGLPMGQVVPFPGKSVGAERPDQVGVGGDVLQPVEPGGRPAGGSSFRPSAKPNWI